MSNIFKEFVLAIPVKTPLTFGHNDNIVIESMDFSERKRNGITVKANTFIKLTKVNPEDRTPIANTEINFWNLDSTKDFVYDNFISQFTALASIIDALGLDVSVFEADVMSLLEDSSTTFISKFLKTAANAKSIQAEMVSSFEKLTTDKYGIDSTLLKCKMVSNKDGYMNPANEYGWILPMDSEDELPAMTSKEQALFKKAMSGAASKASPDATGKPPTEVKVAKAGSLATL